MSSACGFLRQSLSRRRPARARAPVSTATLAGGAGDATRSTRSTGVAPRRCGGAVTVSCCRTTDYGGGAGSMQFVAPVGSGRLPCILVIWGRIETCSLAIERHYSGLIHACTSIHMMARSHSAEHSVLFTRSRPLGAGICLASRWTSDSPSRTRRRGHRERSVCRAVHRGYAWRGGQGLRNEARMSAVHGVPDFCVLPRSKSGFSASGAGFARAP